MRLHWIKPASGLLVLALVSACATDKDKLMPHGPQNMLELWNQSAGASGGSSASRQLMDARLHLRRPLSGGGGATHTSYTRTAQNEIYSQFKRLPNPDLVMYVFPHLTGTDPAPVPGYSTVLPLYQRIQYAMPGERTEDY
ncbi:TIGR03751 family conjugal transfer lipoprotein [Pseudomonas sp. DWP3-1-2]|uniref:TIGR03751 family conjugal transfer lipoprotein n=1 Tax=Pseudomonas sp. DWP3-1-2 TaxID=2804645 RepID=UPI003CEEFE91